MTTLMIMQVHDYRLHKGGFKNLQSQVDLNKKCNYHTNIRHIDTTNQSHQLLREYSHSYESNRDTIAL